MIRFYLWGNMGLIALFAWRVHRGMPIGSALAVGFLALVLANGALTLGLWRTRKRPKPLPDGRFPWREWRRGHALGIGFMVLIALQGADATDLAFIAILGFGGGNLMEVACWLWDRHTLRRRAKSE